MIDRRHVNKSFVAGRHQIDSLDQIENESSYICSSHADKATAVDVHHMMIDPQPFIAGKRKKTDYAKEDNRFIREGLADDPSDDDLPVCFPTYFYTII